MKALSSKAIALAFLLLAFTSVFGQSGQAELTGQVRDQTEAALTHANIKLIELATNRVINTTTNHAGIYTLTNLQAVDLFGKDPLHKNGRRASPHCAE